MRAPVPQRPASPPRRLVGRGSPRAECRTHSSVRTAAATVSMSASGRSPARDRRAVRAALRGGARAEEDQPLGAGRIAREVDARPSGDGTRPRRGRAMLPRANPPPPPPSTLRVRATSRQARRRRRQRRWRQRRRDGRSHTSSSTRNSGGDTPTHSVSLLYPPGPREERWERGKQEFGGRVHWGWGRSECTGDWGCTGLRG